MAFAASIVARGIVAAGSSPGAALFFATYETMKPMIGNLQSTYLGEEVTSPALTHMIAASIGETAACLVRVPTEVVKSRRCKLMQLGLVLYQQHLNWYFRKRMGGHLARNYLVVCIVDVGLH